MTLVKDIKHTKSKIGYYNDEPLENMSDENLIMAIRIEVCKKNSLNPYNHALYSNLLPSLLRETNDRKELIKNLLELTQ